MRVSARRLTFGSAYRLGFCGLLMATTPFALLLGLVGLSGGTGVYWNG